MMSSEWNVVWDGRTADRWVWDRGGGWRVGVHARRGIVRGGPVLCFFGVSEFESSQRRRENFFPFFLRQDFFSQGGIGKKRMFFV